MSSLWSIKMRFLICLLAILGVFALGGCSSRHTAQETKQAKVVVAPAREGEVFTDVRGGTYRLPGPRDSKAVVLIFIYHDCPISNGYVPEIARLSQEFSPRGIAFCAVYADPGLSEDNARQHTAEYDFHCPTILDPTLILARRTGATVTPEAVVLSPSGQLLYRGRIDDRYFDYGKQRSQPNRRELRDALAACVEGRPIVAARTKAVGCAIYFETN